MMKLNERFKLYDFYQTDVDDFHNGEFQFKSAKKVSIIKKRSIYGVESIDDEGYLITVYSYTHSRFERILLVKYRLKPWHNHYKAEGEICNWNNANHIWETSLDEFFEMVEEIQKKM